MKTRISLDGTWRGAYAETCAAPTRFQEALDENMREIRAEVPGALETDLEAAGILPEIFRGENVILTQDYENAHYCLARTFDYHPSDEYDDFLVFEGIDCFADIFIDGVRVGENHNMLIGRSFPLDFLTPGCHELFVHIRPAALEARRQETAPFANALPYQYDSLGVRKAPSQYGWDIMPRTVSCGIWKHVYIDRRAKCRVSDLFTYTVSTGEESAKLRIVFNTWVGAQNIHKFSLRLILEGNGQKIEHTEKLWHTGGVVFLRVPNPRLWWPRNYGEPSLYSLTAELYREDLLQDRYEIKTGIRTVQLKRTSTTNEAGDGEFCFIVNGKRIFAMGTNWVPVDAFHARDEERLPEILPMLDDLGCNIVRCWGGNVYENDLLYDYCDSHGVMIWQDFTMACAVYPNDEAFAALMREEAEYVVKRLRNHPALVLWSGDNECDQSFCWGGENRNPNDNAITRRVLPDVLKIHDFSRPYLPSSPYIDDAAYQSRESISEDHLWGPRDYFKGDYYKNTVCHFASETGYHGCPSVESLKKYIDPEHLWPCLGDRQWLVHAATPDGNESGPYGYRIRLMWNQAEILFGKGSKALESLESFSLASQISQAEAKKYFIERFRLSKWRRTGIIWWNLIDGWPQISDAVVDYYLDKKLAYGYIKRSQQPLCLMFDEPRGGNLTLYAVNDTREDRTVRYTVEDDCGRILAEAEAVAASDASVPICSLPATDEKRYYIVRWSDGEKQGLNHYFANLIDIDFDYYQTLLSKLRSSLTPC